MKPNYPQRALTPTPNTASEELHNTLVEAYSNHFAGILTPELMIAQRKGCYATVINATSNGLTLEAQLGSINAKTATEQILNNIQLAYSAVPVK